MSVRTHDLGQKSAYEHNNSLLPDHEVGMSCKTAIINFVDVQDGVKHGKCIDASS